MIEIVPATNELVQAYYGKPAPWTLQGYVALENGKPIGLAGLYREGPHLVAFSDIRDEMRIHKWQMLEGVRLVKRMMRRVNRPVFAKINPREESAPGLLARLGFRPLHDDVLVRMPQ